MNDTPSPPDSSADPAELAKFDRLAREWWDPEGPLRTLHAINPVRLAFIGEAAGLEGKRVLDIGCGGGLLCEAMARRGAEVTGIDASEAGIRTAREHQSGQEIAGQEIEYHVCTVESFAGRGRDDFDVITCMEMLEHVADPAALLHSVSGLLKPGGDLILATINRSPRSYFAAILAAEYVLGLLPRGTHDYARFIRPSELCLWLRRCGFETRRVSGMQYLPFINKAILTGSPAVNYLIHARRDG